MKSRAVYILSCEAKDIFLSNNLLSDKDNENIIGYNTKDKDGKDNLNKFVNAFDYSLDLIKLRKVYYSIFKNKKFSFLNDNKKEFSNKIINIDFTYSVKQFNKYGSNLYVKYGYLPKQLSFVDNVCIIDNELIGIIINSEVSQSVSDDILGKYFSFDKDKKVYKQTKEIKTLFAVKDIQRDLYDNGFFCNGIKYVRYKRSAGSSRVGKCLFIDEKLYDKIHKYDLCGLDIKDGDDIDLAAFESYIALTLSSIIDTMQIKKENILVINDYDSVFKDNVISVANKNGELVAKKKKVEIKNSIWDGQSLIDRSLMGKYQDKGMILLRNRFFKSCCFNSNIQEFFKDNKITDIGQLNGFTLAENIEDIKLITTPNSIKYLKFGTLEKFFDNLDETFGIVKYDKPTPYIDGYMVQSHYQLLNTLQFDIDKMTEFLKPTTNMLRQIRDDVNVFKYWLKCDDNYEIDKIETRNDLIFKLIGINDEFCNTKIYTEFKKDFIKSFVKNVRNGHILINGNYSTICSNPIEMLYSAIGQFDGKSNIGIGNIYSTRFEFDRTLIASRSPHITMGNIWLPYNKRNILIEKYINSTNEIVYINTIGDNVMQRLQGCDMDSDSILLSDNQILIDLARINYDKFLVPTSFVEAKKINRKYTKEQLSDLDIKTSVNRIGEIVNLSQELNSLLWHNLSKNKDYNFDELYLDICILSVMSGIEIDKAKKEFDINTFKEMNKIRKKYSRYKDVDEVKKKVKPKFFRNITLNNGFVLSDNVKYESFNTSMDFLQTVMNREFYNFYKNDKNKDKKLIDILNCDCKEKKHPEQVSRILKMSKEAKTKMSEIWTQDDLKWLVKKDFINNLKIDIIKRINNWKLNKATMLQLLKSADSDKFLFQILLSINSFVDLFYYKVIKNEIEFDKILDIYKIDSRE